MLIFAFIEFISETWGKKDVFLKKNVMGQCLGIYTVTPPTIDPFQVLVPLAIFLTCGEKHLFPRG